MAPRRVQPPTPTSCLQLRGRGMQGLGGPGREIEKPRVALEEILSRRQRG